MNTNPLYQKKYENFQKALNRQESDYVPNAMTNNGGGFFWGRKTAWDFVGDHMGYARAVTAFLDET